MRDAPPERAGAASRRVLFVCADPVGERMAGLGIRFWELARALTTSAEVTVAHGGSEAGEREGVQLLPYTPHAPRALRAAIARADAVVTHPQWPLVSRWLRRAPARTVIDLYCPETLETLELLAGRPRALRRLLTAGTLDRLHDALRTGHHFMCASEAQRDLWLGAMLALRLIGPDRYDGDPALRELIDLVPFGLPREPPSALAGSGPRELLGLGEEAELVLWNGGIWSWLDAETAIRAVAELAARRPQVRLVFMGAGGSHPAAARSVAAARALAAELGVLGSVVSFHEQWIAYQERASWLLQADCAVSTHADHLESRFAYRTRVLDCLWAGLPVVCTSGDELATEIAREDLGVAVAPGDSRALAAALERVLDAGRGAYGERLAAAAGRRTWAQVSGPLERWLQGPLPPRLGDTPEAMRPGLTQRTRELAYLAGGRRLLARRSVRREP